MNITATGLVNRAISDARDLPTLVAGLNAIDPALGEQITGKALVASRTPWGTLAAGAVGWLASSYGLGLDSNTSAIIGGGAVLLGSYAMRAITRGPITSLVTPAAPEPPAPVPFAR